MRIIGKLLILLLVFTIGFASAFGALFGVGYYAYTSITLDKAGVNTDAIFDREAAEVQLSSLTIADLISEVQSLQGISDKVTLDMLVLRYGLIIPEEVDAAIPLSARTLPLTKLFSEEGLYTVLDELYIGQLLNFEKGEIIAGTLDEYNWYHPGTTDEVTGIYSVLVNYTLGDLVKQNFDVNKIMADLTIAKALNLHAETYSAVYLDENGVLVPVYDIGTDMKIWFNTDGVRISSTIAALADIPVSELSTSLDGLTVASLLGYVEYSSDFYSYEVVEANGDEIVVLTKQSGLTAELSDLTVADFSNGKLDEKVNSIDIATVLEYTYDEETGKYYDKNGQEVTGPMSAIAGSAIGNVGSDINDLTVGEVCGFTKVDVYGDGSEIKWYSTYSKEDPSVNEEAEGVMASIADLKIGELNDNDAVTDRIEQITVADALGYKLAADGKGYVDKQGQPVTGVIGVIAGTRLMNIQSKIDDTMIGELCGFTKVEEIGDDGEVEYKWYSTYSEEDPSLNVEAEGVMAVMVDLKVNELKDDSKITERVETVTVADALGYKPAADGNGYVDKQGAAVVGVMGIIAGTQLNAIQSKVDESMVGEVSGFTKVEDENGITWYSEYYGEDDVRNVEASGVMNSIADLKVSELKDNDKLTERIETITVADALGYEETADGYVDRNGQPVTAVMGVIAGTELNGIQNKVDNSMTGELMGFTPVYGENGEITSWTDNGEGVHVLMNKIASTPFSEIGSITDTLTINDIIPAEDRNTGFIQLLPEGTNINNIATEVNYIFDNTKISVFVEKDIIDIDDSIKHVFVDDPNVEGEVGDLTIGGLLIKLAYYELAKQQAAEQQQQQQSGQ